MSEWTCKSVGLRIIELPKSVFPAGMAEDIGSYPFFCSSPVVKKINHWLHDGNTILMGTGGVATVHYGQNRFAYSTDTWAFTVADSATNISFLFRQFEHKLKQIEYFGFEGSGLKHLQKEYIRKLELLTPPLNEQNVVVKVLDTIDTAIQQTQAIINKLKQLKQGLLHDLLTRGVDANGELRPCYDDAPHLYKESPLGWIPKEWELSTVGNEFEIQLGKMLDVQKNNGVMKPYVGNKAVQWDRIDLHEVQQVPLSHSDMKRFRLEAGDLLVCEGGEVGRAAIWEAQLDECYYQKAIHRLRPINGFNPRLMLAFLRYWITRDSLSEFISKTSIAHLTQEKLMTVPLPTPPSSEQNHLVTEILAHKHRQEQEEAELKKLTCLKSALMDDLLTGRIRVTSLLQTEASSV